MKDEKFYQAHLTTSGVPEHIHGALIRYLTQGLRPGGFLEAVLTNDLRMACERADEENKKKLWEIVSFLYNYAPILAWGSVDHYETWVAYHQLEREKKEETK